MTEEIPRIILRLIQNKEDTRLEGGEVLLPMEEAIIAACKQHFSDREILSLLLMEKDLRKALVSDAILDYVPADKRQQVKAFFSTPQKTPRFDEAIVQAALYIAGERRSLNGMVLRPASELEAKVRASIVNIVQSEFPKGVYVAEEKIAEAQAKYKKRQETRRSAILIGSLLLGGCLVFGGYSIKNRIANFRNYLAQTSKLEQTITEREARVEEALKGIGEVKTEREELSKQYSELATEYLKMGKYNEHRTALAKSKSLNATNTQNTSYMK